jgi:lysophospholipase L1-like esterase
MMFIRSRIVCLALFMTSIVWSHGQTLALHDGDRVVFYGDSITAQRLYTRFVEDFLLTRYPQMHVSFRNAGVPGDTVNGGYTGDMAARLKRDLIPYQPTVVTIMLGMNDGYYMPFNQKYLDIYEEGYRRLLHEIESKLPSARITLISPTPYDEVTHGTEFAHYNEVVGRHAAFVKELATASHFGFSDFYQTETNLVKAAMQRNQTLAGLLVPDRIHPAEASHWIMAADLARIWGLSPVVSSVHLDALQAKVITAENTLITGLTVQGDNLQWTQADSALPLPLPLENGEVQFALGISDLAAMDQQILRVDGLTAKRYKLEIDGHAIASFNREEFTAGINLALYATPMESQAKNVDGTELKRTRLDEAHFILAIEDPKVAGDAGASTVLEAKDGALAEEQRKAAQPLPHRFELLPE